MLNKVLNGYAALPENSIGLQFQHAAWLLNCGLAATWTIPRTMFNENTYHTRITATAGGYCEILSKVVFNQVQFSVVPSSTPIKVDHCTFKLQLLSPMTSPRTKVAPYVETELVFNNSSPVKPWGVGPNPRVIKRRGDYYMRPRSPISPFGSKVAPISGSHAARFQFDYTKTNGNIFLAARIRALTISMF